MTFKYVTLGRVICQAYDVEPYELFGPAWLNTDKFDIEAVVPRGATKDQVPMMIRDMLAERFQLRLHKGMKVMPVYELSADVGGPKLKMATADQVRVEGVSGLPALGQDGFPEIPPGTAGMLEMDGRTRWQEPDVELAKLCGALGRQLGRPVVDKTGLRGRYNISLYWESGVSDPMGSNSLSGPEAVDPANEASEAGGGPSIFKALKKQLGLRLDSTSGAASVVFVDSVARKPTEN